MPSNFTLSKKTPLEIAITLDLEADKAINLHREYLKILGFTEFARVYQGISDDPWPFVNFVMLVQDAGLGEEQVIKLIEITKEYPRVTSQYEKRNADMNILENEISNLAKDRQRPYDSISNLRKAENQLQLTIKELQAKHPKLVLQRERTEYFVKEYHDNNVEYKG